MYIQKVHTNYHATQGADPEARVPTLKTTVISLPLNVQDR